MPKLTKRYVDGSRPETGLAETFAWDTELKGFGIRLMPSGVGSYILKYRTTEGRQRKLALARLGAVTPDEARKLARDRLHEIAKGADPSAERKAICQAITVAELCDLYLDDAKARVKPSTWAMDRSRIETHVKPLVGTRAVNALTGDGVGWMQADIVAGKSAKGRVGRGGRATGGKGAASRTLGMFSTILEFARRRNIMFHLIDIADARVKQVQPPPAQVIPEPVAKRIAAFVLDIVLPHLLRAEAVMFSTARTQHARWIAGWMLAHRYERVTTRDIAKAYGALRSPDAERELRSVMDSLVTVGWLEPLEPTNPVRSVHAWMVNPAVHTMFAATAAQERSARLGRRQKIAEAIVQRRQPPEPEPSEPDFDGCSDE